MKHFLSIDVGTTCCKCQLFGEDGAILEYIAREYPLKNAEDGVYADVSAIRENVFGLIAAVSSSHTVDSICLSCFGETFVALDENDEVLCDPMLYTDKRGEEQAAEISAIFGADRIFALTGAFPHAMYSSSKLLWIKENRPDVFSRIDKILLVGDYLGYLLTGKRVIDYSLAARTGLFDIVRFEFSAGMCRKLGFKKSWFSRPERAGTVVGKVNFPQAPENCVLVLGAHDQVCTALGAGITGPGKAVDGLGTVECITAVYKGAKSDPEMGKMGFCCVPYAIGGLYCTYIVTYSCGAIVKWFKNEIMHRYRGGEKNEYAYLEKDMRDEPTSLYLLPLFSGSMIPYQDLSAKGAIVGLTVHTTDREIYQAIMEALALEMRFETSIARRFGISVKSAVATGGGANSDQWLKIKANAQGIPYATLRSFEGGLCGCAVLQASALTKKSIDACVPTFVKYDKVFAPSGEKPYEKKYAKYKKLYKNLKEFF